MKEQRHYAMPSSGDPEQDRRDLEAFRKRRDLMARGRCPNDDGDLVETEPNVRECPTCGFVGVTRRLFVPRNDG